MFVLTNSEGLPGFKAAVEACKGHASALDIIETSIRIVELDPTSEWVGLGGAPNILGEVECDASLMDGVSRRTGAVGSLRYYPHAISVARQIMERLPHGFLSGIGAERFAEEIGESRAEMLTAKRKAEWESWKKDHRAHDLSSLVRLATDPSRKQGTTFFLVQDHAGNLSGGVSSSGAHFKYPGRIGDSALIGAGLYADARYGAAACTHTGEMTIRCSTAHAIVEYLRRGASVNDACHEAIADLKSLHSGLIGEVMVHAVSAKGDHFAASVSGREPPVHWWCDQK